MSQRVLVYGGRGQLGATIVSIFKKNNWHTISIDIVANDDAGFSIILDPTSSFETQANKAEEEVNKHLAGNKLDSILCVAGGWVGGNIANPDIIKQSLSMWQMSVWPSVISAKIASKHLKEGGLVQLTGASAALNPTPGALGYGVAKAAVHHLIKSLAQPDSGLPAKVAVVGLLPIMLDTPQNRKAMPTADTSSWTPMLEVANTLFQWSNNVMRPESGALVIVNTKQGKTDYTPA